MIKNQKKHLKKEIRKDFRAFITMNRAEKIEI